MANDTLGCGIMLATSHQHWHIDVSYIKVCSTFYYLCSFLDGFSRFLVHWDLRESMREADVEVILQRAKEKYSEAKPRIISDNGPQFIARDFEEFIPVSGMTHVRTSNSKIERWHKSLKSMDYDLGYFDLETRVLEPLENPFGPKVSPM
jgi:putative transposase